VRLAADINALSPVSGGSDEQLVSVVCLHQHPCKGLGGTSRPSPGVDSYGYALCDGIVHALDGIRQPGRLSHEPASHHLYLVC